jgi:hypothetical protein
MGIEDLLGGRDLGDVKKAVGFVMENSDDFQKVLNLVRGLPDDAVGFLGKLPGWPRRVSRRRRRPGRLSGRTAKGVPGRL